MKDPTPIAVASRSFSKNPQLRQELEEKYPNVTYNETGKVLAGQEFIEFLKNHTKAITGLEIIDNSILGQLPKLKVISKYGVGLDMLDLNALEKRGVLLGWTPGVNKRSVAELTLCFMLALLHHVGKSFMEIRQGGWKPFVGRQLSEKTVGIIGCGNVGKDLVHLIKPFGCKVLIHDIRDYSKFYALHDLKAVPLEELLVNSDIVTLHVPLDSSTHNLISKDRLAVMKATSILINTARGSIVDEKALKEALKNGSIAGAAVDVFEQEPPQDQELIHLPQFIGTPHIGGHTEECMLAMGRAAIGGLDHAKPALSYLSSLPDQ